MARFEKGVECEGWLCVLEAPLQGSFIGSRCRNGLNKGDREESLQFCRCVSIEKCELFILWSYSLYWQISVTLAEMRKTFTIEIFGFNSSIFGLLIPSLLILWSFNCKYVLVLVAHIKLKWFHFGNNEDGRQLAI